MTRTEFNTTMAVRDLETAVNAINMLLPVLEKGKHRDALVEDIKETSELLSRIAMSLEES